MSVRHSTPPHLLGGPVADSGYPTPAPTASQHPRALYPFQTEFLSLDDSIPGFP